MKYTMRYILDNRYDKNRGQVRKMAERFVIMSAITKFVSPAPTYILLNFGVHPDTVTIASFIFIVFAAFLFVIGQPVLAVCSLLVFAVLDSVDGDMARCVGPTKHGCTLDSFGADFFYAVVPVSIGYYLFSIGVGVWNLSPAIIIFSSALVSLSFLLYRLFNAKVDVFRASLPAGASNHSQMAKETIRVKGIRLMLELYRHVIIRGNFFSEAGMIFWFSLLVLLNRFEILAGYLIVLLAYNLIYLLMNFVGINIYLVRAEKINF
ncbi:CDP-alcohol phosphatidyltransferase family protein [Candidatus Wolfebacteria bacterium]|nr:CDP-alcohol phosphatidyltransferase family protein [Candidatus Wolfebacteria bacterium]